MSFVSTGSAWREIPVDEALRRARAVAARVGITRITDITRLDRISFPCAIAVRPTAPAGSLCVTAGKGLTITDALVGAAMEGIELYWAEPGRSETRPITATARDVLDERPEAILDFAPVLGMTIDLDGSYPCAWAEDIMTGERVLVPAETVWFPFSHPRTLIGAHTNGLASGSSVAEATLHALAEVIERDALAFNLAGRVTPVDGSTLPEPLPAIHQRLLARGFDAWYFLLVNPFGVPCVGVSLIDRDDRRHLYSGYGCHAAPEIAAARALTEAIQSRVSVIHGGRDDLVSILSDQPARSWEDMNALLAQAGAQLAPTLKFDALPDLSPSCPDIATATTVLAERLRGCGMPRVLRVVLTPPDYPVAVVRVIVPGLECTHRSRRRGPRLRDFLKGKLSYL